MRPLRLEMEGFGAFKEPCVVDFSDIELVALVGNTGSGKSTIIDAITFALYGSVARYDDNRRVAPVINQTSTRARVRLDFEVGENAYAAVRLVQRRGDGATTKEARLERGDDVLAADAATMSTEVARLIGLDVDQFNRTVVLPQGSFAVFLHDSPADRQATLRQLLGLGIYQRVAIRARRDAADLRSRIDVLRPDLDEGERELTDERRVELVAHRDAVSAARSTFIDELVTLAEQSGAIAAFDDRLIGIDDHIARLDDVRPPDGLGELDRRLASADADVERSGSALVAARNLRRDAENSAANGPDLMRCTSLLRQRQEAAAAAEEHHSTAVALVEAEDRRAAAQRDADEVTTRQVDLDALVATRRLVVDDARAAVGASPKHARIEQLLVLHERRASGRSAVEAADVAAATARRAIVPLAEQTSRAEIAERDARHRRDELQQRAGAAGFVALLEVGRPCPLCLHPVDDLPDHHVSEDLEQAGGALVAAIDVLDASRRELQHAERLAGDLGAVAAADRRVLGAIDGDLDGAPDEPTLRRQLVQLGALEAALDRATTELDVASAAADEHRSRADNAERLRAADQAAFDVVRLRALADSQHARIVLLAEAIVDVPSEPDLLASIAEAERLAAELRSATAALTSAEAANDTAAATRVAAAAEQRRATAELHAVRDRLGPLDPPRPAGERVGADWSALIEWAVDRRARLESARVALVAEREILVTERDAVERSARQRCAFVLGSAAGDLTILRDRLAQAETSAESAVSTFDERRARHVALGDRVDALVVDATVAEKLGHHLRAAGFEAWLMEAALDELVDAAALRLRELSSGQFSLELVEREFMVRDHANGDERRSARTLSGGETFLASLSLALALADATAELSPDGAPTIESIFLDEGFGSLDPGALEVVAAAIEELGSTGRMVAVVTHIRDLADRMPVRLEVTKVGTSSRVDRVEA